MGLLLGALATAGVSAGGQWLANQANKGQAQDQQNWNENQWNKQNQQNLEQWNRVQQRNMGVYEKERQDGLEFWNMQNQYNSPQAQMARFKEAGLNPNLIYGQGNSGNASPIQNPSSAKAEAIKSQDVKPYSRPEMQSVTKGLDTFGDTQRFKNLQAQTDNLKAQENVIEQDALLKAQQTAATALKVTHGKLDYGIAKELRQTSVEAATVNLEQQKLNIRKSTQGMQHTGVKMGRDKLELQIQKDMRNPRIQQAYANIQSTLSNTKGQNLSSDLKREQLKLRKLGLQDSDAIFWRALVKNWDTLKGAAKTKLAPLYKSMPQWYKSMILPFH